MKLIAEDFQTRITLRQVESEAAMALFEFRSAEQRRALASQLHEKYSTMIN